MIWYSSLNNDDWRLTMLALAVFWIAVPLLGTLICKVVK